MNSVVKSFPLLILFSALNSCTIEKRRYSSGYYLEWSGKMGKTEKHADSGLGGREWDFDEVGTLSGIASLDNEPAILYSGNPLQEIVQGQSATLHSEKSPLFTVRKQSLPSNTKIKSIHKRSPFSRTPHQEMPRTHGLAIASLVLGILSVVSFWGGLVFSILAIIFGWSALRRIRKYPEKYTGRGLALAGLICGLAGIAVMIAIFSMV